MKRKKPVNTNESKPVRLVPQSNAPECTLCPEVRKVLGKENNTYIYATRDRVRYCKCRVCGNTFKWVPVESLPAS